MRIITYKNAIDYLNDNLDYLESEEASNNLIIGISMSRRYVENDGTLYLSVLSDRQIIFTCIMTEGQNLLVYGNAENVDGCAMDLIDHFKNEKIEIPGIIGPAALAIMFAESWKQKANIDYKVKFEQMVFILNKIKHIPEIGGHLKLATIKDLTLVTNWFHVFMVEAMDKDDANAAQKIAMEKIRKEQVYFWIDKTEVAMAAIARPTNHGITINYVYTPKESRGNGYGTKIVAELSKRMLEGKYDFCSLFTNLDNPTSNNIYKKIGYEPIKEFRFIEFVKESLTT